MSDENPNPVHDDALEREPGDSDTEMPDGSAADASATDASATDEPTIDDPGRTAERGSVGTADLESASNAASASAPDAATAAEPEAAPEASAPDLMVEPDAAPDPADAERGLPDVERHLQSVEQGLPAESARLDSTAHQTEEPGAVVAQTAPEPESDAVGSETTTEPVATGDAADSAHSGDTPLSAAPTAVAPAEVPAADAGTTSIFATPVPAPTPPKRKGNRAMGILIDIVAAIAFAVVFAVFSLGWFWFRNPQPFSWWESYLQTAVFITPVVVFFLAAVLLTVIVNRAGWWAHIIGSLFVGVIVYFGYIAGALLTMVHGWPLSSSELSQALGTLWTNPFTLAAGLIAREVTLWFGAWTAGRGKKVRARNLEAQREYERSLDESVVSHVDPLPAA